jgi:hypothetical protein
LECLRKTRPLERGHNIIEWRGAWNVSKDVYKRV